MLLALTLLATTVPPPAKAAPTPALLPLSEADMNRGSETGCTFSFDRKLDTLIQATGTEVMIRTPEHLNLCRYDEAAVTAFTDGKRTLQCGGRQLRLQRTGRTSTHEASDSAAWRATLTVTQGAARTTIPGMAGVAC
jgi:hypothetical protein